VKMDRLSYACDVGYIHFHWALHAGLFMLLYVIYGYCIFLKHHYKYELKSNNAPKIPFQNTKSISLRLFLVSLQNYLQVYSVRGLEPSKLGGSHGCPGRLWDRFLWQVYQNDIVGTMP